MYLKKAHIHFVGIGGIGMSGIATILKHQGYTISGCDQDNKQESVKLLQKLGCFVFEGNNTSHCTDNSIDILVYSSAISPDNPEIISAQKKGIPTIPRALMLAELMRTKYSIAIAGSHGKTTTTSLVSHLLIEAGIDPTVIIGGHLKTLSNNARFGNGDFLVAEADESDRSFLHLYATLAIITNIDLEHLETYKDLTDIKQSFTQFINKIPFYGKAILCIDDENVRSLFPIPHIKTMTYGLDVNANLYAQDITLNPDHSIFTVVKNNEKLGSLILPMPGEHNIQNALGAVALTLELGISFETIQKPLSDFEGVDRRFTFRGTYKEAEIFDDYGHHPKEIAKTLQVAKRRAKNKITVVFQHHRYSRTKMLWNDFIDVFLQGNIDHLIITDIFPASEKPLENITGQLFVQDLLSKNPSFKVTYTPFDDTFSAIKATLSQSLEPNDLLLLLGAGKVYLLAKDLI